MNEFPFPLTLYDGLMDAKVYVVSKKSDLILLNLQYRDFRDMECVCFTDLPAVHICLLMILQLMGHHEW